MPSVQSSCVSCRPWFRSVLAGALIAIAATWAAVATARADESDSPSEAFLVEAPAGETIETLLSRVADTTGIGLLYARGDRTLGQTLGTAVRIRGSKQEVVVTLRQILFTFGVTLTRLGSMDASIWHVDRLSNPSVPMRRIEALPYLDDARANELAGLDGLLVSAWIPLPHIADLKDARNAVHRLMTANNLGVVTEVPDAYGLLVTDFAPNVAAVYRVLRAMDGSAASLGAASHRMEAFRLEHARPSTVVPHLNMHFAPAASDASPPRPQPVGVGTTAPRIAPTFSADDRSHQILATGSESDLAVVRRMIALIDVPPPSKAAETPAEPQQVAVFPLRHVDAREAWQALERLLQVDARQGSLRIYGDQKSNRLVLSASAALISRARSIVQMLDVPPPTPAEPDATE